jgi:hypothetical protein
MDSVAYSFNIEDTGGTTGVCARPRTPSGQRDGGVNHGRYWSR